MTNSSLKVIAGPFNQSTNKCLVDGVYYLEIFTGVVSNGS